MGGWLKLLVWWFIIDVVMGLFVFLENKVVIVIGVVCGIGFVVVKCFVMDGVKVVIVDVDDEVGEVVVEDLSGFGLVFYIYCNVVECFDVCNMVVEILNVFGDIDVLVNNVGIVVGVDFFEFEEEDFDWVLLINFKGVFFCF